MAERLGERVILGAWVSQINHGHRGVGVIAGDLSVRAKQAIVTLPPTLAGRICYVPALPAARDLLTESTPMGWVIKVHCVYPTRFWLNQNLSGAVTSDEGVSSGPRPTIPPIGLAGHPARVHRGGCRPRPRTCPAGKAARCRARRLHTLLRRASGQSASLLRA